MLSAVKVAHLSAKERPYKVADAGGLYLLVTNKGGRLWRFKYRFGGKVKTLALGVYPDVSLATARAKRDAAREQIKDGIDPAKVKRQQKHSASQPEGQAAETFEVVAREWHEKFNHEWMPSYAEKIMRRLELNVFPWIGARPIKAIEPRELLSVLRRMGDRGALESTKRVRIICEQVFKYAVACGKAERNPAADIIGALPSPTPKHMAAITDPKLLAPLLRDIDGYSGSFIVKCALQLQALFFCRPGELRHAEWSEIDFDTATWTIPAHKRKLLKRDKAKTENAHIVPLSSQAITILKELHALTANRGSYVFPSHRSAVRPMSDMAVLAALRSMGYEKDVVSGHGFRATARTILDEVLHVRPDLIEAQLGHAVRDVNRRAYNRTSFLEERRRMMATWADYLDGLKAGAKVIPFRTRVV